MSSGGERPSPGVCRSRLFEAGGSSSREVPVRMASGPDKAGTCGDHQTVRVRQARREGVTRVNQWWNLRKSRACSNLVDRGRRAVRVRLSPGAGRLRGSVNGKGRGGHGESLRRSRDDAAGEELGAVLVDRYAVNVGTSPWLPFPPCGQRGGGQVHRRLLAAGRGGGVVVVRGRESRSHGEGRQLARN